MSWQNAAYFSSILVTIGVTGVLSWYAWRHREAASARAFRWLALSVFCLALAEALLMLSPTEALAYFWFKTRFIALAFGPVSWLIFALVYSGRSHWLSTRLIAGLLIIPVVTQIAIWIPAFHTAWLISDVTFVRDAPIWVVNPGTRVAGVWFGVHLFFASIVMLMATVFLMSTAWRPERGRRGQTLLLVTATLVPLVLALMPFSLANGSTYNPLAQGAMLCALLLAASVFRFRFGTPLPAKSDLDGGGAELPAKPTPVSLLLVFVLLFVIIGAIGFLTYQDYEREFRYRVQGELAAIANLKVDELQDWRRERLGDAATVADNPAFSTLVERVLTSQGDTQAVEYLQTWLGVMARAYGYQAVQLLDTAGVRRIAAGDAFQAISPLMIEESVAALAAGQVRFLDFHRDFDDGPIYLSILIPIRSTEPGNQPVGTLILNIDPLSYLYPFLHRWPGESATAETLIVRRDGEDIVYLNDTRFDPEAALSLRIPLTRTELPAVRAVLGYEGFVEGTDYRGVSVVAAVRSVPDSPWFLVAKTDTAEVFAPLRARLWQSVMFFSALIAAAGAAMVVLWRQQRLRYYRQMIYAALALRESEQRFHVVFEKANDAIHIANASDVILDVNSRMCEMMGYSRDDLLAMRIPDLQAPESRGAGSVLLDEMSLHGASKFEGLNLHRSGKRIPVEVSIARIERPQGDWFVSVVRDISDRKEAEAERDRLLAELQEQASRIQGIVDTVPEGVILVDESGRLLLANPIAVRDLATLADARVAKSQVERGVDTLTLLGGRPLAELIEPPRQGGRHEVEAEGRIFEVIARAMPDGPGGRNWLLVLTDVTQRRQQQRVQQVQERLAAVGQLAAGIAHDFNNIMGVITIYSDLLAKTADLTPKQQHHLGTIRAQADLAAGLIHQILDFGRRAPMTRTPVDLLGLVREHAKLLERTVPANIRIRVEADRNDYIVLADPARLQPALMNLALNACDAMPAGGALDFSFSQLPVTPGQNPLLPVTEAADWVRLDVSDSGHGIAPQHLPRIFEPFFTTKGPGKGTGLGLAQVYGIVQQHDGAIEVRSQLGAGTVFSIYLPLFAVKPPEAASTPDEQPHSGTGRTILLAEDNSATREGMTDVLQGYGYDVLPVATGAEALRLLAERGGSVDLVLSDLVMPEMGGIELYRQLKSELPRIKVLFMTGYALDEGGHEELVRDGVAWLQKPFSASTLAAKLREVLAG